MKVLPVLAAVSVSSLALAAPAAALTRNTPDSEEVTRLRRENPHAVELLEKGEALATAGALKEADAVFQEGAAADPMGSLFFRRRCEALTALGRRAEAVPQCLHAIQNKRTNTNTRALVRALVAGPSAPATADLAQAASVLQMHRANAPPGVAAGMACDIAESLGDAAMLKSCAEELQEQMPGAAETRTALKLLEARCPPARFWFGWGAIATAAAFTLADALRKRAPRMRRRAALVAAAGAFAAALAPAPARAQAPAFGPKMPAQERLGSWPIDDDDPEKSVPSEKEKNGDPLQFAYWLQDVTEKGLRASKHGDHAKAAKYFAALAKAVPDRSVPFVKMCEEYEAAGDLDKAVDACGAALLRDGVSVSDYTHFVHLVINRPYLPTTAETKAVAGVFVHMRQDPAGSKVVDELECEAGQRLGDMAMLRECTAGLAASAPDSPKTVAYQWAFAVQDGRLLEAQRLVGRAAKVGVAPEELTKMNKALDVAVERFVVRAVLAIVSLLALGACAVVASRALRRRQRDSAKKAPPPSAAASAVLD